MPISKDDLEKLKDDYEAAVLAEQQSERDLRLLRQQLSRAEKEAEKTGN